MTAAEIYTDKVYYNNHGRVSPFAVTAKEYIEEILNSKTPQEAADKATKYLRELNDKFRGDKTFNHMSEEYLDGFHKVASKQKKVESVAKYLYDADLSGNGMAVTSSKTKTPKCKGLKN